MRLRSYPTPHPFVRRSLVASKPSGLAPGALVTMQSPEGVVLGDGFYNGRSDISLRRLTDGDVRFDDALLGERLQQAVALRRDLPGLAEATDAWRVVHAEGDGLSGLVVDRFGDVLAVQLHSAGWVDHLEQVLARLHALLGTRHHRAVLSERTARLEGVRPLELLSDGCPDRWRLHEHGLRFEVRPAEGHKTGWFCDQRSNRRAFASWTSDRDVLDLCCYTGGFAVTAAALSAPASVSAVDLDEKAVAAARTNADLNQVRVRPVHADAFDWARQVGQAGRRFHAVVLDPSRFITSRRDLETGRGKVHDLNRLALGLLHPAGLLLTCCCSGLLSRVEFGALLTTAARKAGRRIKVLSWTGAGEDHPVWMECPESEYLKCAWLRVD